MDLFIGFSHFPIQLLQRTPTRRRRRGRRLSNGQRHKDNGKSAQQVQELLHLVEREDVCCIPCLLSPFAAYGPLCTSVWAATSPEREGQPVHIQQMRNTSNTHSRPFHDSYKTSSLQALLTWKELALLLALHLYFAVFLFLFWLRKATKENSIQGNDLRGWQRETRYSIHRIGKPQHDWNAKWMAR